MATITVSKFSNLHLEQVFSFTSSIELGGCSLELKDRKIPSTSVSDLVSILAREELVLINGPNRNDALKVADWVEEI